MICTIVFNEEQGCIKPITDYEVNIYAIDGNELLGTFSTNELDVPFTVNNETAADVAAAFTGTFKDDVEVDTEALPEDVLFCYRVISECGEGEFCCVRIISDAEPMMMPLFAPNPVNLEINDIT